MTRFLTIRQTLILSAVGIKRYLSKQLKISLPWDTNKALSCLEDIHSTQKLRKAVTR